MESRIDRYETFISDEYVAGLLKGDEYSLAGVTAELRAHIAGGVNRIVFTGMGCSAIVSDLVRGYLLDAGSPIDIHVVNDYDFATLIPNAYLSDPRTLFVVSSYSGHSTEPVLAFDLLVDLRDRVLLLTSGGRLAQRGYETGTSVALWQLSAPDREYPLFHVTQFFAILVAIFRSLRIIGDSELTELAALAQAVRARRPASQALGESLAADAYDANVLLVAQPLWHDSMLKLCKMHLNEIAMVPAGRNYFHEFCHSEVATLSDPERRHCLVLFADDEDDSYTREKQRRLLRLLTQAVDQNRGVRARRVDMRGETYLEKLFTTLDVVQHMTLGLARRRDVLSRDLISEAAGNPWYHSSTIARERAAQNA